MKIDGCKVFVRWDDGVVNEVGEIAVEMKGNEVKFKKRGLWFHLGMAFIKQGFRIALFGSKISKGEEQETE